MIEIVKELMENKLVLTKNDLLLFKQAEQACLLNIDQVYLPVLFSIFFEIIHVAALWYIHRIFVFSFFGIAVLYKFACIFDSKISPVNIKFHYK